MLKLFASMLFAALLILISGCAARVERFQPISSNSKIIAISSGSYNTPTLLNGLKRAGWKVVQHRPETQRYLLTIKAEFDNYAYPENDKMFSNSVVVTDQQNKQSVFSIQGSMTEKVMLDILVKELQDADAKLPPALL